MRHRQVFLLLGPTAAVTGLVMFAATHDGRFLFLSAVGFAMFAFEVGR